MARWEVKSHRRFDLMLFFYVMCLLVGSSVWLRYIPTGDLAGRGIPTAKWIEARDDPRDPTKPVARVDNFRIEVHQDECEFLTNEQGQEAENKKDFCGATNPTIRVEGFIDGAEAVSHGVTMVLYSSGNFRFWDQSNKVQLSRDMFSNDTTALTTGAMNVTTEACFGEPGAYYVVACAREGVPGNGASCEMPPCVDAGPPFPQCLAIATACVSTCGSHAVETRLDRGGRLDPLCANGTSLPLEHIEKYARETSGLSAAYVIFLLCYTFGLMYFFIMYMPGCGVSNTTMPSWDLFLGAILDEGHVTVKLSSGNNPTRASVFSDGSAADDDDDEADRGEADRVSIDDVIGDITDPAQSFRPNAPSMPPPAAGYGRLTLGGARASVEDRRALEMRLRKRWKQSVKADDGAEPLVHMPAANPPPGMPPGFDKSAPPSRATSNESALDGGAGVAAAAAAAVPSGRTSPNNRLPPLKLGMLPTPSSISLASSRMSTRVSARNMLPRGGRRTSVTYRRPTLAPSIRPESTARRVSARGLKRVETPPLRARRSCSCAHSPLPLLVLPRPALPPPAAAPTARAPPSSCCSHALPRLGRRRRRTSPSKRPSS